MRTRIKICGLTNAEDAEAAVQLGADALGFILVPDTPRYVGTRDDLRDILRGIPPMVMRTAVVTAIANLPVALAPYFDAVQFYRGGPTEGSRLRQMRVCRVAMRENLNEVDVAGVNAILLDTLSSKGLGGTGEAFDWSIAAEAARRFTLPIILAGGLTPENVGEAIRIARPFAVDVSSGIESAPGRKDHDKMRRFIRAVREADQGLTEG